MKQVVRRESPKDMEAKMVMEASSMSLQEIYDKKSSLLDIDTTSDMAMSSTQRVKPAPSWCGHNSLVISMWGGWVQ